MNKLLNRLVFVDCEAAGQSPVRGCLTEFGAVRYVTRRSFYGQLFESTPDPKIPAVPIPGARLHTALEVASSFQVWLNTELSGLSPVFVSDNPAFDWQWISGMFDEAKIKNPFGHSGRRISDFYAGLMGDFTRTQGWKKLRLTEHTHHPVDDAMGNVEAFARLLEGER